jgi:nucleoside-diphosphate-sugar epimerase
MAPGGQRERVALVTGATGFLGSRLAERLVREGACVHGLVRRGSAVDRLPPRVRPEEHDGTTAGLCRVMERVRPAEVFHLAARFVPQEHRPEDVEGLIRDNVMLSTQLLEAMAAAGSHRLVLAGTAWQHRREAPEAPVALYAATKQAVDDIVAYYTDATPLRAITLKLYDTYGPGDRRAKLFALLVGAAASGEALPMSPGEQLLDLVHVDDVVEAFLAAAARLERREVAGHERYTVPATRRYSLREVVALLGEVLGREVPVLWGRRPYRQREVMMPWDGPPLPGWRARIGLAEGLRTLAVT